MSPQLGSLRLLQVTKMLVNSMDSILLLRVCVLMTSDDMLAMGCLIVAAWCPAGCKGGCLHQAILEHLPTQV